MKSTHFVTFDRSAAKYMAETLGFRVSTVAKGVLVRNSRMVRCATCRTPITIKNAGNFVKGRGKYKVDVYCDNPVCLAAYIGQE